MPYGFWKPYVSQSERKERASTEMARAKKEGSAMNPVVIEGRTIAQSFWGKAWCGALESHADYSNRLPRGRTYVRNGSVIDLQISRGEIRAKVTGSRLYKVKIEIAELSLAQWKMIRDRCEGHVSSVVELLRGKVSDAVMTTVATPHGGLFPMPREFKFTCSCPDWASMCKHVAATLYGVGACLDQNPELLFELRGVDASELAPNVDSLVSTKSAESGRRILAADDLGDLFGVDMDGVESHIETKPVPKAKAKPKPKSKAKSKSPATRRKEIR